MKKRKENRNIMKNYGEKNEKKEKKFWKRSKYVKTERIMKANMKKKMSWRWDGRYRSINQPVSGIDMRAAVRCNASCTNSPTSKNTTCEECVRQCHLLIFTSRSWDGILKQTNKQTKKHSSSHRANLWEMPGYVCSFACRKMITGWLTQ